MPQINKSHGGAWDARFVTCNPDASQTEKTSGPWSTAVGISGSSGGRRTVVDAFAADSQSQRSTSASQARRSRPGRSVTFPKGNKPSAEDTVAWT